MRHSLESTREELRLARLSLSSESFSVRVGRKFVVGRPLRVGLKPRPVRLCQQVRAPLAFLERLRVAEKVCPLHVRVVEEDMVRRRRKTLRLACPLLAVKK